MEALQRLVDELTNQMEAQRLQIQNLEEIRQASAVRPVPSVVSPTNFDASRIPDAIKMVVPYAGDPKLLATWLKSVEDKIKFAEATCPSQQDIDRAMPLWTSIIRDKIVDKANEALVSNHTPVVWADIQSTLREYFGDKRDLGTLVTKISYLQQGSRSITDFYNECRELLADIIAKISLDNDTAACAKPLATSYEYMVTNAYIDGLNEPYSTLTRVSRPASLNEAHQSAIEQYNASQRKKDKFPKQPVTFQKPALNKPQNSWQNSRPPYKPFPSVQHTPYGNRFPSFPSQNPSFNRFQGNASSNNASPPPQAIKPDPSGQNRYPFGQNSYKQVVPYQRTAPTQVNSHESSEEIPTELPYAEDPYINNPQQQEIYPQTEQCDELNFCTDPDQQNPE